MPEAERMPEPVRMPEAERMPEPVRMPEPPRAPDGVRMPQPLQMPELPPDDDAGYRQARALADPARRRVLRAVIDAGRPIQVVELSELFGVHHTAIRQHLRRLVEAGLVSETTSPPRGRGRPRLAFVPTDVAGPALHPAARYRELAAMLAEAVSTGEGPRRTGRRIGERIGSRRPGLDAVEVILDESSRLGFDPVIDAPGPGQVHVVLRNCPFEDVAAEHPLTICQLHIGLAEGVAAALGGVTVAGMEIHDSVDAGCRLRLHTRRQ
jgi:predicted ArsR family transcriptional regulator